MSDLVTLAERYISLVKETEDVRAQMRRLLANGSDPHPAAHPTARPTIARRLGDKKKPQTANAKKRSKAAAKRQSQPHHPNALKAKAAETQILDLLRATTDGMKTIDVARATGTPSTSTQNRLARLQRRGLVSRAADERWSASALS